METNLYPPWIPLVFTCTAREMVMFSQASVSDSVHGAGWVFLVPAPFQGGHLWSQVPSGAVGMCRGGYVQRVGTHSPPPGLLRPTYSQHEGGMHPIGTLSFF